MVRRTDFDIFVIVVKLFSVYKSTAGYKEAVGPIPVLPVNTLILYTAKGILTRRHDSAKQGPLV